MEARIKVLCKIKEYYDSATHDSLSVQYHPSLYPDKHSFHKPIVLIQKKRDKRESYGTGKGVNKRLQVSSSLSN